VPGEPHALHSFRYSTYSPPKFSLVGTRLDRLPRFPRKGRGLKGPPPAPVRIKRPASSIWQTDPRHHHTRNPTNPRSPLYRHSAQLAPRACPRGDLHLPLGVVVPSPICTIHPLLASEHLSCRPIPTPPRPVPSLPPRPHADGPKETPVSAPPPFHIALPPGTCSDLG